MEDITPNDKYRRDYAVVAKHLLCESTQVSLYQIERFAMSAPLFIDGVSSGFLFIWDNYLKGKVMKIGQAILDSLFQTFTGGIGVAIAAVIGGLVFAFNSKKQKSIDDKLKEVLDKRKVDDIEAYLKAYQSSYEAVSKCKYYCSLIKSPTYLIQLESRLNSVFTLITNKQFQQYEFDFNLSICALFYKLAKVIIQIYSLIDPSSLEKKIGDLKQSHKQLKKKMIAQIQKRINIGDKTVQFYDSSGKTSLKFCVDNSLMVSDLFTTQVFNQIFRCPITKLPIQELFSAKIWTTKSEKTETDIQKLITSLTKTCPYLGAEVKEYSRKVTAPQNNRIREIGFNEFKKIWTGYYENLQNNSGSHDEDFDNRFPKAQIDKYRVIFVCKQRQYRARNWHQYKGLLAVTNDHKIAIITRQTADSIEFSDKMSYSLEIDKFSYLKSVNNEKLINLQFTFQPIVPKKVYGPFHGLIATQDKHYMLGYGIRFSKYYDWNKGYTFHKQDPNDSAQKLIFEAITPIAFFKSNKNNEQQELCEFTCRIMSQYNQSMYMARDDRNKKSGLFGINTEGGELIHIKLSVQLGSGEYNGSMFVGSQQLSTYVSESNNLEWTRQENDRQKIFYMRINQE